MRMQLPRRPGFSLTHLEVASACPGSMAAVLVLHFQDSQLPGASPWPVLRKSGPCPLESHCPGRNKSPERGRCRRLQVQVNQVVYGGLHLGGIILRNLGARG